jgi:MOSC domain-containing protein YiiM
MSGSVLSVQTCPGHRKPMVSAESAVVIENLGLQGDMHALPDSSRQVLLMESETLAEFGLKVADVKENITTAGIKLMSLVRGQRLQVGRDVVLEITAGCAPCSRLNELRPGLRAAIDGRRGMLTRVRRGGTIRRGDPITILDAP